MKIIKNDEHNKTVALGLTILCVGFLALALFSFLNGGATTAVIALSAIGIGTGVGATALRVANRIFDKKGANGIEMISKQIEQKSEQEEAKEINLSDIEKKKLKETATQENTSDVKIISYDSLKNQSKQKKTKQSETEQNSTKQNDVKVIELSDLKK